MPKRKRGLTTDEIQKVLADLEDEIFDDSDSDCELENEEDDLISAQQNLHAEIVEVEIEVVLPSIVSSGNFTELKSHYHLYGAQGQRQAYLAHATMNFVGLDLTTSDRNRNSVPKRSICVATSGAIFYYAWVNFKDIIHPR
ncbi:hypothetical protein TNCV_4651411 [Trichonephila clavipes]|nr:hypothetical protein TNCV_4651411 [Trichonephila clavipes]